MEEKKKKKEENVQMRTGCKAEKQGAAADHQEVETASKRIESATVTIVHGDSVPPDPPEPDPFCR